MSITIDECIFRWFNIDSVRYLPLVPTLSHTLHFTPLGDTIVVSSHLCPDHLNDIFMNITCLLEVTSCARSSVNRYHLLPPSSPLKA